jgi:hypothetical protein
MSAVQVRDVPDETRAVLRRRAAERGMSLQEYLLALLNSLAAQPTVEEVLSRAGGRAGGSIGLSAAADLLREERDAR